MSTNYITPKWMHPPTSYGWSLDEIKGGVVISTYPLTNPLTLFGRSPPSEFENTSVITTAHESCSRLHARIAFDKSGVPWLRDLGSANLTMVNKRNLPTRSTGMVENIKQEGGRGVMLFPGDVIQFGASTRLYVLNGPSEFDAGAVKARLAAAKASGAPNASFIDPHSLEGITLDKESSQEEMSEIPNQHRKLYEKIQSKKNKLQMIQHERQILETKAQLMELSSGQTKQLESLEEREETLLNELQELEESLREKIDHDDAHPLKRRREDEKVDDYEDENDFYDRTKHSHIYPQEESNAIETVESLKLKASELLDRLKVERERTKGIERKMMGIQLRFDKVVEQDGNKSEEDIFFLKNDMELVQEEHKKSLVIVHATEDEIKSLAQVLKVVASDMIIDMDAYFLGTTKEYESLKREEACSMPPPAMIPTKHDEMKPPPVRKISGPSKLNDDTK